MRRLSSALSILHFAFCILHCALASAQPAPGVIAEVRVEQEGQPVTDAQLLALLETTVGEPLSVADVRESIRHLVSLNRFDNIEVYQDPAPGGVRVRYVLYPLHPIDRIAFRGMTGLDEGELRRAVTQRFGIAPAESRADAAADLLRRTYRNRGYPDAKISWHVEPTHNPDRATLVFDIDAGRRLLVKDVRFEQVDPREQTILLGLPPLHAGRPYDADEIQKDLQDYVDNLKSRGYYEARASHTVAFDADGAVVTVAVARGPKVMVAFAGDPLPEKERDRLVPIRAEGSADEDLLEDSQNAIVDYLHARGYRDAKVDYTRDEQPDQLTITFHVTRGPHYSVNDVTIAGNRAIAAGELEEAIHVKSGDAFVEAAVGAAVGTIRNLYRSRGFTRAMVQATPGVVPNEAATDTERRVNLAFTIAEGPRTTVRRVTFVGNMALSDAQLRNGMMTIAGAAYSEGTVAADRDRIELEYRNRGYDSVVVEPTVMLAEGDTQADIRFTISEGPQILVDHIIIVGNERTSTETIERELLLKPGEPLGYSARIESQQRLSALGLFRRVQIDELQHGGDARRDVMVQVEEAPPTTISYGGGLEVGSRLRTDTAGTASEQYEFVPRGFFEIGRRNLWGKNRSIDLFTRLALRSRDLAVSDSGITFVQPESRLGFNEYRVFGTYREPKVLGRADVLLTGILDQGIRSSFNYRTRQARAEIGWRLSPVYSLAARYSFENTKLFDEQIPPGEQFLVDKLFPQVRLSKFSATAIRDTRDDLLDPSHGKWFIVDGTLAAKAWGSQVGFDKVYLQAYSYNQLPTARRVVLALAGRLGLAHSFDTAPDNESIVEIPGSERFFAGGDTTVRGFSLDRLGSPRTISDTGFPKGGNGVVLLNAEIRVNFTRNIQGVTFMDGGNVFRHAVDLDLRELRGAYGVGGRYKSPVGPIRVDIGFKVHPVELSPGNRESAYRIHVSLGQAF
jgi:outer membrane protein assembly complex protein YaeT